MELVLIGLNHRTATVELRERVAFSAEQAQRAANQLRERGILEETLVLSTCNRSELYGVPPEESANSVAALEGFLASFHQLPPQELNANLYRHRDREVVRHLYRVAGGLDSMLLGEAEILGQVREAYRAALDCGATGPVLNRVFQGALEVGKRVRSETDIGTRPMSVAFAGVKLAERIFGSLKDHRALILGAGEVSEQVVDHLGDRGIAAMRVANRTTEHARELAHRVGAEVVAWEHMSRALDWPDMIVTSVASPEAVLTRAMLADAMEARGNRALFVIDLGVPRNVEAGASELYNLYLYNIDDLREIVEQNKKARQAEVPRAEAIIEEHVEKFFVWRAGVDTNEVLKSLRERLSEEREVFLRERLASSPHLGEAERAQMSALLDDFLNRVLLDPAERLRGERELRRKLQNLEALRDLFRLDQRKP
jgi:glutamyl-tRNA reductase